MSIEFSVAANLGQAQGSVSSFIRTLQQLSGEAGKLRGVRVVDPKDFSEARRQLQGLIGSVEDFRKIDFAKIGGTAGDFGATVQSNLDQYLKNNPFRRHAIESQIAAGASPFGLNFGQVFPNQRGEALAGEINHYHQALMAGTGVSGPAAKVEEGKSGFSALLGYTKWGLGLSGVMGALGTASEAKTRAEAEQQALDRLIRHTNSFGRSLEDLAAQIRPLGHGLQLTEDESAKLADTFARTSRVSEASQIVEGTRAGVGLARSYGEDPGQITHLMGQLSFLGATGKSRSDMREFAGMFASAVYQGGMSGNMGQALGELTAYLQQQGASLGRVPVSQVEPFLTERAAQWANPALAGPAGMATLNQLNQMLLHPGGGMVGEAFLNDVFGPYAGYNPVKLQRIRELGWTGDIGDVMPEHKGKIVGEVVRDYVNDPRHRYPNDPDQDQLFRDIGYMAGMTVDKARIVFGPQSRTRPGIDQWLADTMKNAGADWGDVRTDALNDLMQTGAADKQGLESIAGRYFGKMSDKRKAELAKAAETGTMEDYRAVVAQEVIEKGRQETPASKMAQELSDIDDSLKHLVGDPLVKIEQTLTNVIAVSLKTVEGAIKWVADFFSNGKFSDSAKEKQDQSMQGAAAEREQKFQGMLTPKQDVVDLAASVLPKDKEAIKNPEAAYAEMHPKIVGARKSLDGDIEKQSQFDALVGAWTKKHLGIDPAEKRTVDVGKGWGRPDLKQFEPAVAHLKRLEDTAWVQDFAATGKINQDFYRPKESSGMVSIDPGTSDVKPSDQTASANQPATGRVPTVVPAVPTRERAIESATAPTTGTAAERAKTRWGLNRWGDPTNKTWDARRAAIEPYIDYEIAKKHGLDKLGITPSMWKAYSLAVAHQESGGNPSLVNADSGAVGLMQIRPSTAAKPGYDVSKVSPDNLRDPETNMRFGQDYLAQLFESFNGDAEKALAAYNAGIGNVQKGKANSEETRQYVPSVMGYAKQEMMRGEVKVIVELQQNGNTVRTEDHSVPLSSGANQPALPGVVQIKQLDPYNAATFQRDTWESRAAMSQAG